MPDEKTSIPIIEHIAPLSHSYGAWLCDIWGVLHNGVAYFPDAVEACINFRRQGGTVIFLTNAPRPAPPILEQLDSLHVPREAYDTIVTSGDVTLGLLRQNLHRPMFHIGPTRDESIFEGLDMRRVPPDAAEFVLNSGLFDDDVETVEDYAELLAKLKARNLPMICANPDMMVQRGSKLIYCAGALADAYAKLGGEVVYTGKPYRQIYELAVAKVRELRGANFPVSHILAIGDGVKTDILGAAEFGLDAVYIASAVHLEGGTAGLDADTIAGLFAGLNFRPVAALSRLTW
jgi:HAD superfamily hydrolase (TIGR01459 family)